MNPEIKARWVEALRSGEYKQGEAHLRREYRDGLRHCCLGVLCELAVEDGIATVDTEVDVHYFSTEGSLKSGALLPIGVTQWAGLPRSSPCVTAEDGETWPLTSLNDNGMPFSEIADMIEASL